MDKLRPCLAEFIGTFALIFIGIGAIDYAFTQTLLATHPALNVPR